MSDHLTRLLIIGILLLLMVLPLLSYSGYNYTTLSGLREIFWFGMSSCRPTEGVISLCTDSDWLTTEGWYEKLRMYILSQRSSEVDDVEKELLWLYVPDFTKKGILYSIESVPERFGSTLMWEQDPYCSGITVSDKPCHLRVDEMELVSY